MTADTRRLIAEHTRVCVHILYCALVVKLGEDLSVGSIQRAADASRRYREAKDLYIERRREAEQAVTP